MYHNLLNALLLLITCSAFAQIKKELPKVSDSTTTGYTPGFFSGIEKEIADSIPSLGSFLVWQHNSLVYEGYFHGANPQTVFNIKSVTKSFVSALAGIATDKGLLPDVNTPVLKILNEYARPNATSLHVWFATDKAVNDSIRAVLTVKELLTMQAGFDWSDSGPVAAAMISSSDPVRFTLDLPFDEYPGDTFNYNSGASVVFGAALAKCVKTNLKTFADTALFQPAGIKLARWDTDPLGRYIGASEMYMTAQDLLRFGLLYLHNGKIGNRQIIPASWIKASTAEQAKLNNWDVMPNADGYGYYWWRRKTNGHQAFVASGFGGQLICIIPDLDMVVVTTCFLNNTNRGRSEIKRLHSFIDAIVSASK